MKHKKFFLLFFFAFTAFIVEAQVTVVTLSGTVKSKTDRSAIAFVNLQVTKTQDSSFVSGTITDEEGRFTLGNLLPGNYRLSCSAVGYELKELPLFIGTLSVYLDIPVIELIPAPKLLDAVTVGGAESSANDKAEKKSYSVADNIGQAGGSVLQNMQNLPGISVQDGKIKLRGNDKVTVLIDGKQTALTGFGSQAGLDNIPSSAIEKIEVINNPSSKYDANGNAGIINIIMKKSRQNGFNGKLGISSGVGALWVRKPNLPTIRPQYSLTPKINPTLSLNFRKNKFNLFLQVDNLYTETLNKNEFVTRVYDDATVIKSQLKRNRNTNFFTSKAGLDWNIDDRNTLTLSGMFGSEKIIDRGDQPFFNEDVSQRLRLWQFLEDEVKTTAMATAVYQHKFKEAGHLLNVGFNYSFHREDEQYFYDNYLEASWGTDAFKLLSDETVLDLTFDLIKPLRYGRVETGFKLRDRSIPTNMDFRPGTNSVLDVDAGGWAQYKELIPAAYGNYVFENRNWEAELGLRIEYVNIRYDVDPGHNTYKSDGYQYFQPFPTLRIAFKPDSHNKLSLFYNRRVDRPNEVDIRIFPKYDDAEIIKVGNPAIRPQFTNSVELGLKNTWSGGYIYTALYHRFTDGAITRISSIVPGSPTVYALFQNAGKSYNSGLEVVLEQQLSKKYSFNVNGNVYRNQIDAFTVTSLYPSPNSFTAGQQSAVSGNIKLNNNFRFTNGWSAQITGVYLAADLIPQGRIESRLSVDAGMKRSIQKNKGALFFNVTDLLNTMVNERRIQGSGFSYTSIDYYETQVVRFGYSYKF